MRLKSVLAAAACGVGLMLYGEPMTNITTLKTDAAKAVHKAVPGIPLSGELKVMPPLTADYRKNAMPMVVEAREDGLLAIGASEIELQQSLMRRELPRHVSMSPLACTADDQCSDCNACTEDTCDAGTCVHTPQDGAAAFTRESAAVVMTVSLPPMEWP